MILLRNSPLRSAALSKRAFTLTSLMVASGLVLMVAASVIYTQVFGLRMAQITEGKLGANAHSRKVLSKLIEDAHSAQKWRIGQWSANAFVETAANTLQRGNALLFYPDASITNVFSRYYFDSTDNTLKRYLSVSNASGSSLTLLTNLLASGVSNAISFTAQDFLGNTLTNKNNRTVLVVSIPFFQLQNPSVGIGTGYFYQSYTLRNKITIQVEE
jgi:hypothetical protein